MKLVPFDSSDEVIRQLVIEWWELIVSGNYQEAFDMFIYNNSGFGDDLVWSPETLKTAIATYGCFTPYEDDPPEGWIPASILEHPESDTVINNITIERYDVSNVNEDRDDGMIVVGELMSYGLIRDETSEGIIHFDGVPLKQDPFSEMTARFHIKRIQDDYLTLEFLDIHML